MGGRANRSEEVVFLSFKDRSQIQQDLTILHTAHHGGCAGSQSGREFGYASGNRQGDHCCGHGDIGERTAADKGHVVANFGGQIGNGLESGRERGRALAQLLKRSREHPQRGDFAKRASGSR